MLNYSHIRPLIFKLNPEAAHNAAVFALKNRLYPATNWRRIYPNLEQVVAGIKFENPLGLAAGFDKNAECIPALWKAGFGFVEVGTVTPKPQEGNPTPRMFRLEGDKAIINRLGFNNKGKLYFKSNLNSLQQVSENKKIFGINIGKNKTTEDAAADYLHLLHELYGLSAYITINISSPNTPNLRDIQASSVLDNFLKQISVVCKQLEVQHQKKIPIFLKIAPDISSHELSDVCTLVLEHGVDGMIISNTTIGRPESLQSSDRSETGGLSGRPLFALSTYILGQAYRLTEGKIPLIGVGGVSSADDVWQKMCAGASLVQVYSALIYQGFEMVPQILEQLSQRVEQGGYHNISQIIGSKA